MLLYDFVVTVDHFIDGVLGGEGDKSKAARVSRLMVVHDLTFGDIAEANEVGVQVGLAAGGG